MQNTGIHAIAFDEILKNFSTLSICDSPLTLEGRQVTNNNHVLIGQGRRELFKHNISANQLLQGRCNTITTTAKTSLLLRNAFRPKESKHWGSLIRLKPRPIQNGDTFSSVYRARAFEENVMLITESSVKMV